MKIEQKYKELYKVVKDIEPWLAYRIGMESSDINEKKFYFFIGNLNLQIRQKEVIRKGLF